MADGQDGLVPGFFSAPAAGPVLPQVNPAGPSAREVRVTINVAQPVGGSVPQSLERSSRQIASAVRRAVGGI